VPVLKSKHRSPVLTPKEKASLLKTAERLREIGRTRPFTEDEADTAYAIQRLLTDEGPLIPLATVLREIDRDLDRRARPEGQKRNRRVAGSRKT
jgi:hypothetical protein